jgi:hypothetical protein
MFEALNPKPKEETEAWYSKLSTPRRKEETHTRLGTRTKHQGYMKRKPTYKQVLPLPHSSTCKRLGLNPQPDLTKLRALAYTIPY